MAVQISIDANALADFCQRHEIARLSLFGSVLRDDFGPDSDIDFLVEFHPDAEIDLFDIAGMEIDLARLLRTNHKVDLRTPQDLSRYFRQDVLRQAELQYAAA